MLTTLATLAAHDGGPMGGFHWAFILIPLFWILLFVLIFGIIGRRWRQHAWSGHGHPGWGRVESRRAFCAGRHRREGVPRTP